MSVDRQAALFIRTEDLCVIEVNLNIGIVCLFRWWNLTESLARNLFIFGRYISFSLTAH